MDKKPLCKITAATATEICGRYGLNREARLLLRDAMGPREFLEALMAGKLYLAGVEFVAYALPAREAVWWGCLCLQHVCGNNLSAPDKEACQAAVQWVLKPTDECRVLAKAPAEAAGPSSPAAALAAAANQSGDSIASPKAPRMPSKPFASAKAVINAVKLSISKADPIKITETQRLLLELGIGVAEGRFLPPAVAGFATDFPKASACQVSIAR